MILVVSNGHGEDSIGSCLVEAIRSRVPDMHIMALPLVGQGNVYRDNGIGVLGPVKDLPSGGFSRLSLANLVMDLRHGLLGHLTECHRAIRSFSSQYAAVIAVGDVFCMSLSGIASGRRVVFIETAKSEFIAGHSVLETWLMRWLSSIVFARDLRTSNSLGRSGVNAVFVGNLMMDGLAWDVPLQPTVAGLIGLLPGTRDDWPDNLRAIAEVVNLIACSDIPVVEFAMALGCRQWVARAVSIMQSAGWTRIRESDGEVQLAQSGRLLAVKYGSLSSLVQASSIILGLSGTANEQAAGMGKPVVAFWTRGLQYTRGFAMAQKKLLGDALVLLPPNPTRVAQEVVRLLRHDEERIRRGMCGRALMGEMGGSVRAADIIIGMLRDNDAG